MWRPDAKVCGREVLRIQELATPMLAGWILVTTEVGYRVIHKNGLQTQWHDDADAAVTEAYEMQKEYLIIRKKLRRRNIFQILQRWLRGGGW